MRRLSLGGCLQCIVISWFPRWLIFNNASSSLDGCSSTMRHRIHSAVVLSNASSIPRWLFLNNASSSLGGCSSTMRHHPSSSESYSTMRRIPSVIVFQQCVVTPRRWDCSMRCHMLVSLVVVLINASSLVLFPVISHSVPHGSVLSSVVFARNSSLS